MEGLRELCTRYGETTIYEQRTPISVRCYFDNSDISFSAENVLSIPNKL